MVVHLLTRLQLVQHGFEACRTLGLHKLGATPVGYVAALHVPIEDVVIVQQLVVAVLADHEHWDWKRNRKRKVVSEVVENHVLPYITSKLKIKTVIFYAKS
jgi:hypothetical protein